MKKVKISVVCNQTENGGLNMTNLREMQTAFCYNGLSDYVKQVTVNYGLGSRGRCVLVLVLNLNASIPVSIAILS